MSANPLSEHEIHILGLMAEGNTVKEIAAKLYIAIPTARTHRHNIRKKLGIRDRTSRRVILYQYYYNLLSQKNEEQ